MNIISFRIQRLMEKKDVSFRDLEQKTGIPRVSIQRYANGTTNKIPMKRLMVLADALETSISYLLGISENEPQDFSDTAFEMALRENIAGDANQYVNIEDAKEIDIVKLALDIRKMSIDNFGLPCSIDEAEKIADLLCEAVSEGNLVDFLSLYSSARPALREAALSVLRADG